MTDQIPIKAIKTGSTATALAEFGAGDKIASDYLPTIAGYIDGLRMQWVSGTALTVTSGSAYIPGIPGILYASSNIAKTGLSLSASTWYHVYLYDNAGTPDIEIVTTAPAAPYNGTARTKTGDTSRRYVGSALTDASGNLYPFSHFGDRITYDSGNAAGTFFVLVAGAATVSTNISLSAVVPVSSVSAMLRCANNSPTVNQQLQKSVGSAVFCSIASSPSGPGAPVFLDCPIANQAMAYLAGGSGGNANIGVVGYTYER